MNPAGSTRRTRPSSGVAAAPLLEAHRHAGRDPDRVRRQVVGDDLERRGVGDLEQRLALQRRPPRSRAGAQDDAAHRRAEREGAGRRRGRPAPGCAGSTSAALAASRSCSAACTAASAASSARGARLASRPPARPVPVARRCRCRQRRARSARRRRARAPPGRPSRSARARSSAACATLTRGPRLGPRPRVERDGRGRQEARQHRLAGATGSPGSSSMRRTRPCTGADTTNRSRTRVTPS